MNFSVCLPKSNDHASRGYGCHQNMYINLKIILQGLEGGQGNGQKSFLNFFPLKIWLWIISAEDFVSFVFNLWPPLFPTWDLLFSTWFLLSWDFVSAAIFNIIAIWTEIFYSNYFYLWGPNNHEKSKIGFNAMKLRC